MCLKKEISFCSVQNVLDTQWVNSLHLSFSCFIIRPNIVSSLANIYRPNISLVLSYLNGRLVFHLLSAASSERQSSGGYSWGNNVLVWGSRSTCSQSQSMSGYDMSPRQLWAVVCRTLGPLVCCLSLRFVSTLSNPNKRPGVSMKE